MELAVNAQVYRDVEIQLGSAQLLGSLCLPTGASGVVVFVHGSGSSRHSARNRVVAQHLQHVGLATLLFDLLSAEERLVDLGTLALRFDIPLLTMRLVGVLDWVTTCPVTSGLRTGLFGASTGAAVAFMAAVRRPTLVDAVVARGGRTDLASDQLERVRAPTLLVVGANDPALLRMNHLAVQRLAGPAELEVVPRATHLFDEPGALDEVGRLAADWFSELLQAPCTERRPVVLDR